MLFSFVYEVFYRDRFLVRVGRNLSLGRNITFYNSSSIHLGENVYIALGCVFLALGEMIVEDEVHIWTLCCSFSRKPY